MCNLSGHYLSYFRLTVYTTSLQFFQSCVLGRRIFHFVEQKAKHFANSNHFGYFLGGSRLKGKSISYCILFYFASLWASIRRCKSVGCSILDSFEMQLEISLNIKWCVKLKWLIDSVRWKEYYIAIFEKRSCLTVNRYERYR